MIGGRARWNEEGLSESPAVELLRSFGYQEVPAETLESERHGLRETVLADRLARALKKLNPWLSDDNVHKAVRDISAVQSPSLIEANEAVHTKLTYGISLEQDLGDGRKSQQVHFIDFDDPRNNELLVTRQYRVKGTKKQIVPDVVLFVNGIPLVVIECKGPTIGDGWKHEAIDQVYRYQELDSKYRELGAPRLFHTVQLIVVTCGQAALFGTVATPERFFSTWKKPYRNDRVAEGQARPRAEPPGSHVLRPAHAREPPRPHPQLRRLRARREHRSHHPQDAPVPAVPRGEQGRSQGRHWQGRRGAGWCRLAHPRVREEPHHALARAEAPP